MDSWDKLRLAGPFSPAPKPQLPAKPQRRRNFDAAKVGRLTASMASVSYSSDSEIFRALKLLRARSRELANNNDYIKKFLQLCKTNVVGPNGIQLQNRATKANGDLDRKVNLAIELAWQDWGKIGNCDVTGKLSWKAFQRLFIETVARDGEVLVRKVKNYDNKYRFALQILEADHLDENLNKDLGNGRMIRMGVEFDEWRRPVAYHLFKRQPFDYMPMAPVLGDIYERVPASEIIHAFDVFRPLQTRGIPWAHAAMLKLNMLGGYEEAELIAARLGASKGGFFERNEEGQTYTGEETDPEGEYVTDAEPGVFNILPHGSKFVPYDPQHPSGNFGPFVKAALRGISSGLGVAYNGLANDLEGVNFSSIRSGTLEERDQWKTIQDWMIEQLPDQIFGEWLKMAMLSGELMLPFDKYEQYNAPKWQGRRWDWVDPLKDIKASGEEIKMLAKSIRQHIMEQGNDPDEVFADIAKEQEDLKALGLDKLLNAFFYGTAKPADQPTDPTSEDPNGKNN